MVAHLVENGHWEIPLPGFVANSLGHDEADENSRDGVTRQIPLETPPTATTRYWSLALEAFRLGARRDDHRVPSKICRSGQRTDSRGENRAKGTDHCAFSIPGNRFRKSPSRIVGPQKISGLADRFRETKSSSWALLLFRFLRSRCDAFSAKAGFPAWKYTPSFSKHWSGASS